MIKKILTSLILMSGVALAQVGPGPIPPKTTSKLIISSYNLATASGNQTISGFGFTPSSCFGFGGVSGTSTGYAVYNAFSDSSLGQGGVFLGAGSIQTNSVDFFQPQDVTGSNYQVGTITAYGSGSITIAWTKVGSPTGTFNEYVECVK